MIWLDSYIHFMLLLKLLNLVILKMKGKNEYLYHIYVAACMLFPLINPISIYLNIYLSIPYLSIYLSILLLIFLYILYFCSIIDFYNSIWLTYWLIFGLFKVNIYTVIIINNSYTCWFYEYVVDLTTNNYIKL